MKLNSYATDVWNGEVIEIEITILKRSLPGIEIVGLPGSAIKESKVRVRSAILRSNLIFPKGRILLNMAPAGTKKDGAMFDLVFACSILLSSYEIDKKFIILGELTLDGRVRGVKGVLPGVVKGRESGINNFIIPKENLEEASILKYGNLYPVENLKEAVDAILGKVKPVKYIVERERKILYSDFSEVYHQSSAIRAVEIGISGAHNIFLFGPPGVGKSMILNRVEGILPKLSRDKAIETSMIWSVSGKKNDNPFISNPPVRKPHHGASLEALIGGGSRCTPGEISLAHNGVLLLDELPEFKSSIIQSLREPMEDRVISLNRVNNSTWYPSDFILIATANPCPCGNLGKREGICFCSEKEIRKYWKRIGGAIFDRIDLRVPMTSFKSNTFDLKPVKTTSELKRSISKAIEIQGNRYIGESFKRNSNIPSGLIDKYCPLSVEVRKMFSQMLSKFSISNRGYISILKVARTIADLDNSENIDEKHLLEAVGFRRYGDDDYYFT